MKKINAFPATMFVQVDDDGKEEFHVAHDKLQNLERGKKVGIYKLVEIKNVVTELEDVR